MKAKQVEEILVIGGAGFIGSYAFDFLIKHGYEAIILGNLESQIHGKEREKPDYTHIDAASIHSTRGSRSQPS